MRIIFIVVMSMVSFSASATDKLTEIFTTQIQNFLAERTNSNVCLIRVKRDEARNLSTTTLTCSGENASGIDSFSHSTKQDLPMIIAMDKLIAAGYDVKVVNENLVVAKKPAVRGPVKF